MTRTKTVTVCESVTILGFDVSPSLKSVSIWGFDDSSSKGYMILGLFAMCIIFACSVGKETHELRRPRIVKYSAFKFKNSSNSLSRRI